MGRPKKHSDSEILLKSFDIISREGFESFTFQQVSKATKLSPAALVKRFKTKSRLAFLARNEKWDQNFSTMNTSTIENLAGLKGLFKFVQLIALSVDSKKLGEHLRWLGTEADDIKSKKKVTAYFAATRSTIERLLQEAVKMNEITKPIDPKELSMLLDAVIQGSIFQFGFMSTGQIESHLKKQTQKALDPYL